MSEGDKEVTVEQMDLLIDKMVELKSRIELKASELSELNKQMTTLEMEGTEKLKALGRKSYASGKGTLGIREMWRFNLPKDIDNKRAMFTYFKEKGEAVLYDYATVNANKYSAFCKEEWELAKKEGRGMEYRGPGGSEPILFETTSLRRKGEG